MASNLSNTQSAVIPHNHPISDITNLSTQLGNKQDKLEAGSNISIGPDGKTISAIDTKYSAGANININANNEISAVDTKYDNATQTVAGLMSADDKKKLDGIEEGAGAVKVTGVKGDVETNYREGNVNITKANIGLGNVDNTSDANKPISTVTQAALNLKQNIADMPTKLTDFTNDGDGTDPFITKAVNDLTNYYTKTQTYTKSEVNTLISNFGGFEVVATLPTSDIKPNVIYLLGPIGTGADKYQEYIYYNSTWTLIGETTVDLTNYATKTEVEQGLASKITNPSGGTEGQVLVKTQNGEAWQDAPATGVISSNNTYEDMVHLSQAEYEALETKDPNTFYSTPDDESGAFDPENEGTEGQVLTKTSTGYAFEDAQGNVELPYLCFTANLAGSTVKLRKQGSPTAVTLETSTDGNTWSNYAFDTDITLSNIGDKVYFRNTSTTDTGFSTAYDNYYQFVMTGSIAGSGDINYLLNKNSTTTLSNNCYYYLFRDCSSLTSGPQLKSTILKNNCYSGMFFGCANLTLSPQLPATSLAEYCYASMFMNCKRLSIAPELPATTLAKGCYRYMFLGCYSLTAAPKLPATTLTARCYEQMFQQCYSLAASPELPATTLAEYCYNAMFNNCKSLVTLPKLPATALADYCYQNMFNGCINIKVDTTSTSGQNLYTIPFSGTGTTATGALMSMFAYTGGTLNGTPNINTTYYTFNYPI